MKTKKFFFLILLIFSSFLAFSNSPKWEIVSTGAPIAAPVKTSYGFVVFNDGKMFVAFSEDGTKLFERGLSEKSSNLITCSNNDFFYVVSESRYSLTCYNPNGVKLWTKHFDEQIISKPLVGFDGRVFVHSEFSAFCIGLNGKQKWQIPFDENVTSKANTMNDGSILFFYQKEQSQQTRAIRISPYGQKIEDITFAGSVVDSVSTEDGLLILFSEGTLGLCCVKDEISSSVWTIQDVANSKSAKLFLYKDFLLALTINGEFSFVDTKTQTIIFSNQDKNINSNSGENLYVFFDTQKFTILSKQQNSIFVTSYNYNGEFVFNFQENISETAFGFYTELGYVIVCESDWLVKGFLPYQGILVSSEKTVFRRKTYPEFMKQNSEIAVEDYTKTLCSENYGFEEEYILEHINSLFDFYIEQQSTIGLVDNVTFPERNPTSALTFVLQASDLAKFAEVDFSSKVANIIQLSNDSAVLKAAFMYAGYNGYDPGHSIINAIESKFFSNFFTIKEEGFYFSLCDGVFNICKTMGSPILYNQGKRILTKLLLSNYNNKIKNYIKNTIDKILSLQI